VTATAGLHPGLVHHVVNTLGWSALRPLQAAAAGPLLAGRDALLLAPTAGGKTEAATFPVLTAMAEQDWRGLSVLYVCPLRALLNNLHPRIAGYAGWLGRTAGLWHGDTTAGERRRMRRERPDILLTTPESLESLLVSTLLDPRQFFADVRAVVVDEVHALPATTAAGTCSRYWSGSATWPAAGSSASACPPPSATRMRCCAGCRVPHRTRLAGSSSPRGPPRTPGRAARTSRRGRRTSSRVPVRALRTMSPPLWSPAPVRRTPAGEPRLSRPVTPVPRR